MLGAQQISPSKPGVTDITQNTLDSLNVAQQVKENRASLDALGGPDGLVKRLNSNITTGLTASQVLDLREKFGTNSFPQAPMKSFFTMLLEAFSDATLLVLLAAATVSLAIGLVEEPSSGWIEGTAIYIAVLLVANISAGNDYSKELQFRALESSSQGDERSSVVRDGAILRINPIDLVVGDIVVLQAGDMIPADCVFVEGQHITTNEASLTGEPDDLKKKKDGDCFLLSSCNVTEGEECRALVIGIGPYSQWGKIKATLVTEAVNTPLQDKLEDMTNLIGKIGSVASVCTFAVMIINIWARHHGQHIVQGIVHAFILAVTIVVVAIPEGLPLAVTISLAYSTKKMYQDQCFIRVLAACETMGNATCICSDKTGTLTENRMTVVEGWFCNTQVDQDHFAPDQLPESTKQLIGEHVCLNRTAYLIYVDGNGKTLDKPNVIGNKTEGALIVMAKSWGYDYEGVRAKMFNEAKDRVYSFNSAKKRSTAVIHLADGTVRVFCKGATEWVLKDCTHFMDEKGQLQILTEPKRAALEDLILAMADMALRTLLLAHRDFPSAADLPKDWEENLPDNSNLVCDCIVGIIDPLRGDVKEAVATAQRAGVLVRMVTGDNVATARAIARQCGILTNGTSVEGPVFRKMTPKAADEMLPMLQVMARSSPDDKYLLVTRLNGHNLPANEEQWNAKFKTVGSEVSWETHRDQFLPGYIEEWESTRPEGGHVVGVTGDGTNDAPALKAADVGLAMGITGTKVAQGASDIVILDDRFSSIVRAIMWGRSVYDNIRKFLQFQLTVNLVALSIVFIGAAAGFEPPLNAVQMLWVNLVMDTFGALALGTEPPTDKLLNRKPYKRQASLISRVMWRNIFVQGFYQLAVCLVLLFMGSEWFGVPYGIGCMKYSVNNKNHVWNLATHKIVTNYDVNYAFDVNQFLTCQSFADICPDKDEACRLVHHDQAYHDNTTHVLTTANFHFGSLEKFDSTCLTCKLNDYRHNTVIFNAFIFCQVFNEYTARTFEDLNPFANMFSGGPVFIMVSVFSVGMQILLVQVGGEFLKTSPLNMYQWLGSIAFGVASIFVGMLMRFIPVKEDPNSFFSHTDGPTINIAKAK